MPKQPIIDGEPDTRKIRAGIAMLSVVVVVSIGLAMVLSSPVAKLVMFGIAGFTIFRAVRFARALKKAV